MSHSIDEKTQALIAVAVAYSINCLKCMKIHRKKAVDAGVSTAEINEALNTADGVVLGARGVTKQEAEALFRCEIIASDCCEKGSGCC